MMMDWSINLNVILIALGFVGSAVYQSFSLGSRLGSLDRRMEKVEDSGERMATALLRLAEQQARIDAMAQRVDDIQKYGSHRLAEVLEAMRGQIMADFKERFDFLQHRMNRGDK